MAQSSFLGTKLRSARLVRGLTMTEVAERVGVSKSAISQYEQDIQAPRLEILARLCDELHVPRGYFKIPSLPKENRTLFWRSLSSATKRSRLGAIERLDWALDTLKYVFRFVQLPPAQVPKVSLPDNIADLKASDIEEITTGTRRQWNLGDGVISDITLLIENHYIPIFTADLRAEELDAFSCTNEFRPIICSDINKFAVRSRFNLAHELGHLVLHRNLSNPLKTDHGLIEHQAHRFAAAFLLPERSFLSDHYVASLDSFIEMKSKWKVSVAMMIQRCLDLDVISDRTFRNLRIAYSKKGWRRMEPGDDAIIPERPRLIRRCFEMIISNGIQSKEDIIMNLGLHPTDMDEMFDLPKDFFKEQHALFDVEPIEEKINPKIINPYLIQKKSSTSGHL